MRFRFRRRIKVAPGVHINVTQKGISSLSVGQPGATTNISKKGVKTTIGLPGTGISYSETSKFSTGSDAEPAPKNTYTTTIVIVFILAFLFFLAM